MNTKTTPAAKPAAGTGAAVVSDPPTTPTAAPPNVHPADARHHGGYALWFGGDSQHRAAFLIPLSK